MSRAGVVRCEPRDLVKGGVEDGEQAALAQLVGDIALEMVVPLVIDRVAPSGQPGVDAGTRDLGFVGDELLHLKLSRAAADGHGEDAERRGE